MKATELRIGNWVECLMDDGYRTQTTVTHLPCEHWADYKIGTHITDENFIDESFEVKPIPLTEEWLERFGFEYDENDDWFVFESNKGVSFSMDKNGVMYYFGNLEPLWVDILSNIKYVHQLQNLYFALTGEELQTDQEVN